MDLALEITHCDIVLGHGDRAREVAVTQFVLFPGVAAARALVGEQAAVVVTRENEAGIHIHPAQGGEFARPGSVAGNAVNAGDTALVGGGTHLVLIQRQRADHIGDAFQFSAAAWQGDVGFPERGTVDQREGAQFTAGVARIERLVAKRQMALFAQSEGG